MTDPQIWTIIGLFAATVFSMLGIITGWFTHIVRTEIGSLRSEMNTRFESVERRIDGLDRDVQALTRHVFNRPE